MVYLLNVGKGTHMGSNLLNSDDGENILKVPFCEVVSGKSVLNLI